MNSKNDKYIFVIQNDTMLYEKTFRNFTIGILSIILASYVVGGLLYQLPDSISYLFLMCGVLNIVPIIVAYLVPIIYVKRIAKVYLVIVFVPIYILTIICLLEGVVSPLFWYLAIPVYIYAAFPSKKAVKISIVYLFLMLSAWAIALFLRYTLYDNAFIDHSPLSIYQYVLTEIVNAFFALLLICYSLSYMYRFQKLRLARRKFITSNLSEDTYGDPALLEGDNDPKYDMIYNQIIEYLECKQVFLNPDFRIAEMAYELNINAVYLTKAIRLKGGLGFNSLVNHYRVEKVKELMYANTSKYTLEYIYLSSGFKSQSSFNRVFKQEMNMTPSEYYKRFVEDYSEPLE